MIRDRLPASTRLLLFLLLTGAAPAALASVDYAVGAGDLAIDGSAHAADGQVIRVTRTVHNLEGAAPPCPYGYFLNPPTVFLEGNGVPVAIQSAGGPTYLGTTAPLAAYGEPGASDTASDQILIPDGMPPGTYNLVLVLDPDDQVPDVNPSNDDVAVSLNLAANPLQITSPSLLPAAVLETSYSYQLAQAGAGPEVSWTLSAGSLPPGTSLDQMGEISGAPTAAGVFTFVVQLASRGGTQVAVLDLPVAAGSGALSIDQGGAQLPSAIVMSPYIQQLVAQGGVPPYTWVGTIPASLGLTLSSSGVLYGTPQQGTGGPVQFTVIVVDSIGAQDRATLTLQVIAPETLAIATPFLEPAVFGTPYDQPIVGSESSVPNAVFSWSLPDGTTLPAGLQFTESGSPAVAEISGTPTEGGIFPVVVSLSDNLGHSVSRQYVLTVTGVSSGGTLAEALIGERYADQLRVTSSSMLTWSIISGQLPPGLSLSASGAITGTVPTGTLPGTYRFVAAVMEASGAESFLSFEIEVQAAPVPPPREGCATGAGQTGAGLLWLALVWLMVSRPRERSIKSP